MAYRGNIKRGGRLREQKKENFLLKSGIIVLTLLILLVSLIYVSRIPSLNFSRVSIEGNSVTSDSDIEKIFNKNISGFYLKMFSKKNIFIYPKRRITKNLKEKFLVIKDVEISIKDFEELKINIKERRPDSLWCGNVLTITSNSKDCYFVDEEGLIYSDAPEFSGNVFLRLYGYVGDSSLIGKEYLPVSKYQSLKFFKNTIEQYGLIPIRVVRLEKDDMEIWFKDEGRLIYNLNQDIARLSNDLGSIVKDSEFKNELEEKELDYIDLRLGNKVYYKFK